MSNTTSGLGFLAGVGCGMGIALFMAPRAGSKTRAMVANKAREEADQIKAHATDLRDSAADLIEKGQRQREGLKHAVKAGVQAYEKSVS